jgi:hypothetical protein
MANQRRRESAAAVGFMHVDPFQLSATPAQLLQNAGPELDALLSPGARARLASGVADVSLPARTLCLECRLNDDDRVDLALCLATHTAGLAAALSSLGRRHLDSPQWQRCIQLLLSWAQGEDVTLAAVPFLYTAFDLAAPVARMPVPCLSLCADPSFFMRRLGLPMPRAPHDFPLLLLDKCGAGLRAEWMTSELRRRAARCLDAVSDLEVRQLSLMLAREPVALKLDVTLPATELPSFLEATGWRGNVKGAVEQLAALAPSQKRIQLNYVVNPTSHDAPLEIELGCTGPDELSPDARQALLGKLVESGLVRAAKAGALVQMLRCPVTSTSSGDWLARNWYLKLRVEAGRVSSVKAYVGVMQRSAQPPPRATSPRDVNP